MELARQQHDGEERQQRHREEVAAECRLFEAADRFGGCHHPLDQIAGRKHPEGDEHAGSKERHQLDDRLGGDRQHQAVLMFGGAGLARAEQHREHRHRHRDRQRHVVDQRDRGNHLILAQNGLQRGRHRFQLQCDVGHRADQRDQRDGGGDRLALAITRRDEIGDRGDVLRLGERDHPAQQRRAERQHHQRADIDRQEIIARAGRRADRAEKRPGGAIDRQRQRVDQGAEPLALLLRQPVAIARHQEQEHDIAERGCDHGPIIQHRRSLPAIGGAELGEPICREK